MNCLSIYWNDTRTWFETRGPLANIRLPDRTKRNLVKAKTFD